MFRTILGGAFGAPFLITCQLVARNRPLHLIAPYASVSNRAQRIEGIDRECRKLSFVSVLSTLTTLSTGKTRSVFTCDAVLNGIDWKDDSASCVIAGEEQDTDRADIFEGSCSLVTY